MRDPSPNLKPEAEVPMSLASVLAAVVLSALLASGCGEPPRPSINLYRAIQGGDLDQLKRHIYWGTDINKPDPQGQTPLHVAAGRGRLIIARELLKSGADPNALNAAEETPLQAALSQGKTQVADVLLEGGAKDEPQELLFFLVRSGVDDKDSLELLTARGADANAKDKSGQRPLHIAVGDGQRLLTKRLIDLGADVNIPDERGRMPLSIATERGDRHIIDLLERSGARAEPEVQAN